MDQCAVAPTSLINQVLDLTQMAPQHGMAGANSMVWQGPTAWYGSMVWQGPWYSMVWQGPWYSMVWQGTLLWQGCFSGRKLLLEVPRLASACTCTCACTCTHACTHTRTHRHACTHARAHARTHARTRAHTHACTRARTCIQAREFVRQHFRMPNSSSSYDQIYRLNAV